MQSGRRNGERYGLAAAHPCQEQRQHSQRPTPRRLLEPLALTGTPGFAFHGEKDEEAYQQAVEVLLSAGVDVEREQEPVLTEQAGTGCEPPSQSRSKLFKRSKSLYPTDPDAVAPAQTPVSNLFLSQVAELVPATLRKMPRLSEPGPLGMPAERWCEFGEQAG